MQMPISRQLARLRVVFNVVCFDNPVAIRNHHVAIQHIAAAHLRLRVRFHLHRRRIVLRRQHLGHRITHRPRLIRQGRRRPLCLTLNLTQRSCLSRHLLGQQMWMTCRGHHDSYQESNSLQGTANQASPKYPLNYLQLFVSAGAQRQPRQRQTMLPGYCATRFVRLEACQTHHPLRLNDFTEASLDLSTMSSAQRDLLPLDETPGETEAAAPFALKEQAAQRLAAHRARRNQRPDQHPDSPTPIVPSASASSRASRIAAAVAERYANSQTYRAFLAEQAENAIRAAEAAAEAAALNAQAVADAQYQLLADLDQWALTPSAPAATATPAAQPPITESSSPTPAVMQDAASGLTIRLYDADQVPRNYPAHAPTSTSRPSQAQVRFDETEALETLEALDDEIAFRQSPVFEDIYPPIDIPVNLIEFPRQLVAPRKARPRLAEGPLREEADLAQESAQLRIFEVEADQIS